MSDIKEQSRLFYTYLCEKIGTKEIVKTRRLVNTVSDIGNYREDYIPVSSGSKAEGLDLEGSDFDLMVILYGIRVYENEVELQKSPDAHLKNALIMDTSFTKPCFTRLRLHSKKNVLPPMQHLCIKNGDDMFLSNELFKLFHSQFLPRSKIHGPRCTTENDEMDLAICFKCDSWISPAKPWITRSRTLWPPPNLVSKIISFGVLFVAIGCKGSQHEDIEWRISFSVAEKLLIYSFSHTQLLCYALMKIILKEVICKVNGLNGLLCSYFMKTLIFWVSEESDPSMWKPDNLISCSMACLKRLLYCVEYSTLLHYFIPENNLFEERFNTMDKRSMTNLLRDLCHQGWRCFLLTNTLNDFCSVSCRPASCLSFGNMHLLKGLMKQIDVVSTYIINSVGILYKLQRQCQTKLVKDTVIYFLLKSFQYDVQYKVQICNPRNNSDNKNQYKEYKEGLCKLLAGIQIDAVSGWFMLASFFYVYKRYDTSLSIIKYALSKCTSDKIYCLYLDNDQIIDTNILKYMRLFTVIRTSRVNAVLFKRTSSLLPTELKFGMINDNHYIYHIPPVVFAHFLSFLCYYYRLDFRKGMDTLHHLRMTVENNYYVGGKTEGAIGFSCLGIACKMVGMRDLARECFHTSLELDDYQYTGAALGLSSMG